AHQSTPFAADYPCPRESSLASATKIRPPAAPDESHSPTRPTACHMAGQGIETSPPGSNQPLLVAGRKTWTVVTRKPRRFHHRESRTANRQQTQKEHCQR